MKKENTVTLSLEKYEEMKRRIADLEDDAGETILALKDIDKAHTIVIPGGWLLGDRILTDDAAVAKLTTKLKDSRETVARMNQRILRLLNRPWWKRLFNNK